MTDEKTEIETWLVAAAPVVAQLAHTPDDPRYQRAREVLRQKLRRYELLAEQPESMQRYPFKVRWGRERGILEVRDCFDGQWLQMEASQAPDAWRAEASRISRDSRAARAARQAA